MSLKLMLSTRACQLASMTLQDTPTVPQERPVSSLLSIRTRTLAPVPFWRKGNITKVYSNFKHLML